MSFVSRLFLSIKGRMTKNILLLFLVVFLLTISLGSFIVNTAINKLEDSIKLRLGAKATVKTILDVDELSLFGYEPSSESLQVFSELVNLYDDIGELPYVIDSDYRLMIAHAGVFDVELSEPGKDCFTDRETLCNAFLVKGLSSKNTLNYTEEDYEIVDGRMLTQEEINSGALLAVVDDSKRHTHADGRSLKVGDIVTITTPIVPYIAEGNAGIQYWDEVSFQVKVVGILKTNDNLIRHPVFISSKLYMEEMWATNEIENSISDIDNSIMNWKYGTVENNMFYLDNVDSIELLKTDTEKLMEKYDLDTINPRVITSADEFNTIAGPIANMKKINTLLVKGSILATIFILSLTLVLVVRDRKNEIGIYLAMGESRSRVIALQFVELILITLLAFMLSLASSKVIAKALSSKLLASQRDFIHETDDEQTPVEQQLELLDEYSIALDGQTYFMMFSLVLGVLSISIVPMTIEIAKTNPKKILM